MTDDTDIGRSPSKIAASKVLHFQRVILYDPNNVPDRPADATLEGLRAG